MYATIPVYTRLAIRNDLNRIHHMIGAVSSKVLVKSWEAPAKRYCVFLALGLLNSNQPIAHMLNCINWSSAQPCLILIYFHWGYTKTQRTKTLISWNLIVILLYHRKMILIMSTIAKGNENKCVASSVVNDMQLGCWLIYLLFCWLADKECS